jgi:hypothetical protein
MIYKDYFLLKSKKQLGLVRCAFIGEYPKGKKDKGPLYPIEVVMMNSKGPLASLCDQGASQGDAKLMKLPFSSAKAN